MPQTAMAEPRRAGVADPVHFAPNGFRRAGRSPATLDTQHDRRDGVEQRREADEHAVVGEGEQQHEQGADLATACVRYVLDQQEWKAKSPEVARNGAVDGIGGVEIEIEDGDKGDPEYNQKQQTVAVVV